ncbi:hypothetical protein [Nocardioides convexus]|uniref:hypothetical protein n=1 Tax=Nocardioides convexus TaxID=2712224 RepID=UPI00241818CC|nr:hypothetical protein [Nocardioides convexus]
MTVLTARGAEQHAQGTATVLGWINVAPALGMPGKPYAGYGCLTGQGNGQGGREHGQKADQAAGLPDDRRPRRPRPRGRCVGDRPGRPARQGPLGVRACWTRSARRTARGRCWCTAPTSWSPRPTPPT